MWASALTNQSAQRWLSRAFIEVSSSESLSSFQPSIWFVFLLAKYLVSLSTPDPPWDPPLGAHASPSQDGSCSEGFWEEHDSLWAGLGP